MSENYTVDEELPVMAIRGMVMFPGVTTSLRVGRPRSLKAMDRAEENGGRIVLVTQKEAEKERVQPDDLYRVGVVCMIAASNEADGEGSVALVSGLERCRIGEFTEFDECIQARLEEFEQKDVEVPSSLSLQLESLVAAAYGAETAKNLLSSVTDDGELDGVVAFYLRMDVEDKQAMLAEPSVLARYRMLMPVLSVEAQVAQAGERIREDTQYDVTEQEREEYLRRRKREVEQRIRELKGEGEDEEGEDIRTRIEQADLPEEAWHEAERELARLNRMSPNSPEVAVATDYLEWLADLPWHESSDAVVDLQDAQRILDRDHYDRNEVKDRILEYLAVQALRPSGHGAVLCLVGAPGVGKTSMGRSVAEATNREFYRISLGGVRDEAEIRGHRRTYIGALPGAVIRALKRIGKNNPVIMLDEVDKLAGGRRGDPASALLEVLDPEQNFSFVDNYLSVPFDLSKVMFICTANTDRTIPPMLLDRMEVIRLAGYTPDEKLAIARQYLVRKQVLANGLNPSNVEITDEALKLVVERYTREAGVRTLERNIASLLRKMARDFVQHGLEYSHVDAERVRELLGPPKYEFSVAERTDRPGICGTLALTDTGGTLLRVEVQRMAGDGKLTITGRTGEALQESVSLVHNYWHSRLGMLGLAPEAFSQHNFHVHFPAGAVPKEGTSAGLALALAYASSLKGVKVPEETAALGEVTLHGRVLEVDNLAERLAAADRAAIKHAVVPERCRGEIEHARDRQPPEDLRITYVETVPEAVEAVLPGVLETATTGPE